MTEPRRPRVLLADDHRAFMDGIAAYISLDGRLEVVGTASSTAEVLARVEELQPDIIVLDVQIDKERAEATVRSVRRICPHAQITMLSMYASSGLQAMLLHAGADDYVEKSVGGAEVVARLLHPQPPDVRYVTPDAPVRLTGREQDVLWLIAAAQSNQQIADMLAMSVETVKRHAYSIYRKLDVRTRMQAVQRALDLGLLTRRGPEEN